MLPDNIDDAHKMIEDLRRENADRRVKAKAFEEAFGEYNDVEQQTLLDLVKTTAKNPTQGALGFRDLAFQMLKPEVFLEGLDIELPAAPQQEENNEPADEATEGEETMAGLTEEQLQKVLDEREKAAREAAAKEQQEQEIQAIFKEIEDLGFEPGTDGFMGMLSLAQSQAAVGREVDFAELAPKVRTAFDIPEPGASAEEEPSSDAAEKATEVATEEKPKFPSTTDAGGSGAATEPPKDFVTEAKEKGVDPFDAARARAEARLSGSN